MSKKPLTEEQMAKRAKTNKRIFAGTGVVCLLLLATTCEGHSDKKADPAPATSVAATSAPATTSTPTVAASPKQAVKTSTPTQKAKPTASTFSDPAAYIKSLQCDSRDYGDDASSLSGLDLKNQAVCTGGYGFVFVGMADSNGEALNLAQSMRKRGPGWKYTVVHGRFICAGNISANNPLPAPNEVCSKLHDPS